MELSNRFNKHLRKVFPELLNASTIYIAISGGKDSVALVHLMIEEGIRPVLLHCNFHLRGDESNQDATFVEELANKLKLEFRIKEFDTANLKESRESIQMLARRLRYDWFKEETTDGYLVTAHHLDDQLETFLINVSRGTGVDGLKGIPEKINNIRRPLLVFSSDEVRSYLYNQNISFREDSSNISNHYLRNRIRNLLKPVIEEVFDDFMGGFRTTLEHIHSVKSSFKLVPKKVKFWELVPIETLKTTSDYDLLSVLSPYGVKGKQMKEFRKLIQASIGAQLVTNEFIFEKRKSEIAIVNKEMLSFSTLVDLIERRYTEFGMNDSDFPDEDFDFVRFNDGLSIQMTYGKKKISDLLNEFNVPVCIRGSYPLISVNGKLKGITGYLLK